MVKKVLANIKPVTRLQHELQLESELRRVERQHRTIASECAALSGGKKLARIHRVADVLNHEHYNILKDLHVATGPPKKLIDNQLTGQLDGLLSEHHDFNARIKEKRLKAKEIDEQIQIMKRKVLIAQTKVTTDAQHLARALEGQKTVANLENKLETFVKASCAINEENRKLREQIEHYLFERLSFNKFWYGNIANLAKGKKIMLDLIEQATIAYDRRDETVAHLGALREKSYHNLLTQTEEMTRLQRKRDHELKLAKFMDVKGQKRFMKDLQWKKTLKKEDWRVEIHNILIKNEQILDTVWRFSGTSKVNEFVTKFTKQESENHATFNYLAALNFEMETLAESLVDLQNKITEQMRVSKMRAEMQTVTLKRLKVKAAKVTKECDASNASYNRTEKTLAQLYAGIFKLFKLCKCDLTQFADLLGDNKSINNNNVLLFLKILDGQVNDLLLNVYFKQKSQAKSKTKLSVSTIKEDVKVHTVNLLPRIVPTNPCPLCVEKEQVSDVVDILQLVQTRTEAAAKLKTRLKLPDGLERLHNVSACNLPKSRAIIQRRYQ